jgi:hypothetical protein
LHSQIDGKKDMKSIQKILLLTCCVAAFSCTRDSKTIPASTSNATPVVSPTATPSSPPSTAASESGDSSDLNFEGTNGVTEKKRNARPPVTLKTVRTAAHENFDRVVFEFTESGLPGYRIEYVERPVRNCGAGEEVSVDGKAVLLIQMLPANAHTETDQVTAYPERERVLNLPVMKELKLICDFEADVQWILGVASPKRYRVMELLNPARLVVDVKH